jgi:hypothetical protein
MRAYDAGRSVEAERRAISMQQHALIAAAVVLMLTGAAMLVGGWAKEWRLRSSPSEWRSRSFR